MKTKSFALVGILFLLTGCASVVARHEIESVAPQKTREAYLADLEDSLKSGVQLEKTAFRYAHMENKFTVKVMPEGFELTYYPYANILSDHGRETHLVCGYKDLADLRVVEYSQGNAIGTMEIPLGNRCGDLSFWGFDKGKMTHLAHILLMLKQYEGGTQSVSPQAPVQGI